jgi:hypothetical protein
MRRTQVDGDGAMITNNGEIKEIGARSPASRFARPTKRSDAARAGRRRGREYRQHR